MKKLLIVFFVFYSCEGIKNFTPPDFKEKLAITAIINNGNYKNKIIIEKTFQYEYPSDKNASLENLSVIIRSESNAVFEYFNPRSDNRTDTAYLPGGLEFIPGQKYTLMVSEKNSDNISSEIVVPYSPLIPEISIVGWVQSFLPPSYYCQLPVKAIVLNLNFKSDQGGFYYPDIKGYLKPYFKDSSSYLVDNEIIESNSPCLKTNIYSFRSVGPSSCLIDHFSYPGHLNYETSFFDDKTIPESTCNIKVKINLNNEYCDYKKPIRISINSIPKELYEYQKSYNSYMENLYDPFSEPVYIDGNIKGGYGIFAICSGNPYSMILPVN